MQTTYFKGDLAEYNGVSYMLHGAMAYEIVLVEGASKGEIKVTYRAPGKLHYDGVTAK